MRAITAIAALAVLLPAMAAAEDVPPTVFEKPGEPAAAGPIDTLILARLAKEGIQPSRLCSDAVFLRRVHLDVIGVLPTAAEARAFLADADPAKRSKLIDRLLQREEFADYWAMKWADLLRIKSEFPINLWPNAVQAYHRWVRTALRDGMPYDRFARELLTSSGSNFRIPQVNFYRATQSRDPATLARAAALLFMGDRMESWPAERKAGLAAFFSRVGFKYTSEWKEEIVFFDTSAKTVPSAVLPDGTVATLSADRDPREAFADWLISPKNAWFARCIVNRLWYWLLGRGIIQEPDDVRPDNPPSHPQVLTLLEKELVEGKYDLRRVMRTILSSATYQLSSIPRSNSPAAAALFARHPLRQLDAEVLIDAICQITGTTEEYSSSIPEPFTWIPPENRSIALADGSITSSFLEMFGRPPRDTGLASERNDAPTAAQRLHLLNSSHIRQKIENGPGLRAMVRTATRDARKTADELYLMILSRYPTSEEVLAIKTYMDANRGKRPGSGLTDLAWALLNSPEFLLRH